MICLTLEKLYTVSIQPAESLAAIVAELRKTLAAQAAPLETAAASDDEIMEMVNAVIEKHRAQACPDRA